MGIIKKNTFKYQNIKVNSVAFSSDNQMIVSGSEDHAIKIWNTIN